MQPEPGCAKFAFGEHWTLLSEPRDRFNLCKLVRDEARGWKHRQIAPEAISMKASVRKVLDSSKKFCLLKLFIDTLSANFAPFYLEKPPNSDFCRSSDKPFVIS